jgi:hypothetical protein
LLDSFAGSATFKATDATLIHHWQSFGGHYPSIKCRMGKGSGAGCGRISSETRNPKRFKRFQNYEKWVMLEFTRVTAASGRTGLRNRFLWPAHNPLQKRKAAEEAVLRGEVVTEIQDKSVPIPKQGDLSMYTTVSC